MERYQKYLVWSAAGLFVYMPFHIFLVIWIGSYTGGLEGLKIAKDILAGILTAAVVLTVLATRRYNKLFLTLTVIAIIYLLLHLLLLLTTNQPAKTGLVATIYNNRLIWYVLIGYGLALIAPRLAASKLFARILLGVAVVVCVLGLVQKVLPADTMTHFGYSLERGVRPNFYVDDNPEFFRVFSTLREPNSLAAFLIMPGTLALLGLVKYWKTPKRTLFIGLELLFGVVLLLTFSRSAFIGGFLAHLFALTLIFRRKLGRLFKRHSVPIISTLAVLLIGLFAFRDTYVVQSVILHRDANTVQEDSNQLRVRFLREGFEGVRANPEGNGPGTAGPLYTKVQNGVLTENYYLQIAYEVGAIGLIIFIAFLYVILRRLWELRTNTVALALLSSFAGLALMNMLLHTWANEAVAISWFMLAGVTLAARDRP